MSANVCQASLPTFTVSWLTLLNAGYSDRQLSTSAADKQLALRCIPWQAHRAAAVTRLEWRWAG
jgi:hypothetical protein